MRHLRRRPLLRVFGVPRPVPLQRDDPDPESALLFSQRVEPRLHGVEHHRNLSLPLLVQKGGAHRRRAEHFGVRHHFPLHLGQPHTEIIRGVSRLGVQNDDAGKGGLSHRVRVPQHQRPRHLNLSAAHIARAEAHSLDLDPVRIGHPLYGRFLDFCALRRLLLQQEALDFEQSTNNEADQSVPRGGAHRIK